MKTGQGEAQAQTVQLIRLGFWLHMAFSPHTPKVDQQAVLLDRDVGRGFCYGQGRINTPQVPWLQVICPEQVPPFHVNSPCLATA